MAIEEDKIKSMVEWPIPTNVKEVCGFLGLIGHYRRFVKGYGVLVGPLTKLLRKGRFEWNLIAQEAFEKLKKRMANTPVLALPDFSAVFEVEVDASKEGLGAVLMQKGRPIAFFSKGCPRDLCAN